MQPHGKLDRPVAMQQHLHKAQVGLWCHKRSMRPFYAVGGGEAAQLCAFGRYGRQI
jgi:hypothetical protein